MVDMIEEIRLLPDELLAVAAKGDKELENECQKVMTEEFKKKKAELYDDIFKEAIEDADDDEKWCIG